MANTTVYYDEPYGSKEENLSTKKTEAREPVLFWPGFLATIMGMYLLGLEGSVVGGILAAGGAAVALLSVKMAEK